MKISEETQILNFFLAVLKNKRCPFTLKRLLWEYKVNYNSAHPDILCYFLNSNPFYSIFEIKKRTVNLTDDIQENIAPQYKKYLDLRNNIDKFDANLIPVVVTANLFINYCFYDSPEATVQYIIKNVPIKEDTYVFSINLGKKQLLFSNGPFLNDNQLLIDHINNFLSNKGCWSKIYVPFTLKDIEGIKPNKLVERPLIRRKIRIFLTEFIGFIIHKKIQPSNSDFSKRDVFNYIFDSSILTIGDEDRRAIENKIHLILIYLIETLFPDLKINAIERHKNQFRIVLRNTRSLLERIDLIEQKLIDFLSQTEITEYL